MQPLNYQKVIMRFKLTLTVDKRAFGNLLPLDYQYELSSFVYRTIERANATYSKWLHENGFELATKQFRLFNFSHFQIPAYKIEGNRLRIDSDTITWFVSFLPEQSTEEFIKGVFAEQVFTIGDKLSKVQLRVANIELLPEPDFSKQNQFNTLSPVCITRHIPGQNRIAYESPDSDYAREALLYNLKNKYNAFYEKEFSGDGRCDFKLLSHPKSKLIVIKANTPEQTQVKGFTFRFTLQAHPDLMHMLYHGGLGEKNSTGFGMVE